MLSRTAAPEPSADAAPSSKPCCAADPEPGRMGRCSWRAVLGGSCDTGWGPLCPVACHRCALCMGHPQIPAYAKIWLKMERPLTMNMTLSLQQYGGKGHGPKYSIRQFERTLPRQMPSSNGGQITSSHGRSNRKALAHFGSNHSTAWPKRAEDRAAWARPRTKLQARAAHRHEHENGYEVASRGDGS